MFHQFSSVIFMTVLISFFSTDIENVYAQNLDFFGWDGKSVCNDAKNILLKHDKDLEQLEWISRDELERKHLLSELSDKEVDVIIECKKHMLPQLKSEILTKKIGYFEGQNEHDVTGISRVITIENKDYLRFENFQIGFSGDTNPDLHVYLATDNDFSNSILSGKIKNKCWE